MFRILSILSYFLRELIFDSKDEYDLTNSKFNMRKVSLFAFVIISVTLNVFLMNRTVALASTNLELQKAIEQKDKASEKNPKPVPSDSEKPSGKSPPNKSS